LGVNLIGARYAYLFYMSKIKIIQAGADNHADNT
jgi:hypothetical protein